jgi:hypothetical protein
MVTAGAAEEKPSLFKSLIDRATGKGEAGSEVDSETKTKEITKVSKHASVVLDKHCPDIVQPYKLSDNAASLAMFSVKEGVPALMQRMLKGRTQGAEDALLGPTRDAAKQLNWLPMAVEVEYGERYHQEVADELLDRDSPLGARHYPTADAMLKAILGKVGEKHDYDFKLFIRKSADRNALAQPGGFLYIDQGLIDNPAMHPKAYFALGHEIAHVLQRHETKELQSMIVDSVPSRAELVKMVTGAKRDPTVVLANVKVKKDLFTRHVIDQELQADSCATKLLGRVFPDARSLAESLDAFYKDLPPPDPADARSAPQSKAESVVKTVDDVVSTPIRRHPTSEERLRNLRSMYDEVVKDKVAGR